MKYLITASTLFVVGSLFGYILELFYRRFVSQKKWVNPGFLVGPYIPLYGFGVVILYAVSNIDLSILWCLDEWAHILIKVVFIGIMMTVIELIAGLIFIKGMHIKLWDYSDRWGNFKGIICPLFSFIWFAIGCLYYFLLNPLLVEAISWIDENLIYTYFIGGVIGAMIVDTCYSIHLGLKVKEAAGSLIVKYEQFKIDIKNDNFQKTNKKFFYGSLVSLARKNNELVDIVKQSVENLPSITKWWKKNKKK